MIRFDESHSKSPINTSSRNFDGPASKRQKTQARNDPGKALVAALRNNSVWNELLDYIGGETYAVRIQQYAGELVHVPAGWLHWVVNNRPCIKVAWIFSLDSHMTQYVQHAHVWHNNWTSKFIEKPSIQPCIDQKLMELVKEKYKDSMNKQTCIFLDID